MPSAVKGTFWRIVSDMEISTLASLNHYPQTIIYITSLTVIGLLIPYTEPRLLGGSGSNASPFVIALDNAKLHGLSRESKPPI